MDGALWCRRVRLVQEPVYRLLEPVSPPPVVSHQRPTSPLVVRQKPFHKIQRRWPRRLALVRTHARCRLLVKVLAVSFPYGLGLVKVRTLRRALFHVPPVSWNNAAACSSFGVARIILKRNIPRPISGRSLASGRNILSGFRITGICPRFVSFWRLRQVFACALRLAAPVPILGSLRKRQALPVRRGRLRLSFGGI